MITPFEMNAWRAALAAVHVLAIGLDRHVAKG
jgi:hypothetical protein